MVPQPHDLPHPFHINLGYREFEWDKVESLLFQQRQELILYIHNVFRMPVCAM